MLIDRYDAALFDLDGVLYLGPDPVAGAPEAVTGLHDHGVRIGFVTNNAARTPKVVADQLRGFGIPCQESDVVTSAQAAARVVRDRFGPKSTVLAVGGDGLYQALADLDLIAVSSADDRPAAVIQGYSPELSWELITEAALAIRGGALWVATNTDPTRPTDRGLVPGNGAAVAAVRVAVETDPLVAGKPERPLLEETVRRLGSRRPIFVGDRIDTDIAGAGNLDIDSMLVMSGAHGPVQLFSAIGVERPTHIGLNAADLLAEVRQAKPAGEDRIAVGAVEAYLDRQQVRLSREPADAELVDAIWAATRLCWQSADAEHPVDALALAGELSTRVRSLLAAG